MPTVSRPARALRGGGIVVLTVMALRLPTITRAFDAALAAAARPTTSLPEQLTRYNPVQTTQPLPSSPAFTLDVVRRGSADTTGSRNAGATFAMPPVTAPLVALPAVMPADLRQSPSGTARAPLKSLRLDDHTDADPALLATAAYARLAAGDRRGAARLFDAALTGDDSRAAAWQRQRDALTRRWSGSAYSIIRGAGPVGLTGEPVLGGGQSGGSIAFTPDPLSPRPVAATLRGSVAHDDGGRSAFVAAGIQWHPVTGVTLAAERLIGVGRTGPHAWTARLAAGTDRAIGQWRLTAYGEGGILGHASYAAIQGRGGVVVRVSQIELDPGMGVWSSVQRDRGTTIDRVDVGPGIVARAGPFAAEVDYRVRIAGNAAPGSGPVLTLGAAF